MKTLVQNKTNNNMRQLSWDCGSIGFYFPAATPKNEHAGTGVLS